MTTDPAYIKADLKGKLEYLKTLKKAKAITSFARSDMELAVAVELLRKNDAFMKAIAGELPLFQAMFLRGLGLVACHLM